MRTPLSLPPLVYHAAYSCSWPATGRKIHRFPMRKFADVSMAGNALPAVGQLVVSASNVHTPSEPEDRWFEAVHDPQYYHDFVNGRLDRAQERRIGFSDEMRQPGLIKRTKLECAGTVLTVQLALRHGLAANLAGGTHHAHRDFGSGFTILNDLAVAARGSDYAGVQRGGDH